MQDLQKNNYKKFMLKRKNKLLLKFNNKEKPYKLKKKKELLIRKKEMKLQKESNKNNKNNNNKKKNLNKMNLNKKNKNKIEYYNNIINIKKYLNAFAFIISDRIIKTNN